MNVSKYHRPIHSVLAVILLLLFIYYKTKNEGLLWIILAVGFFGLLFKQITNIIDQLWMGLGKVLGAVVSKIILVLFFYLILSPVALLSRVFSKSDPLKLKKDTASTFNSVEKNIGLDLFKNPW